MVKYTIESLTTEIEGLVQKRSALAAKAKLKENKALVGKCFRSRNNYSCPEKRSDYWFIYRRVDGLTKDGDLRIFTFECDKFGEVRIKKDDFAMHIGSSWDEISEGKFFREYEAILKKVNSFKE